MVFINDGRPGTKAPGESRTGIAESPDRSKPDWRRHRRATRLGPAGLEQSPRPRPEPASAGVSTERAVDIDGTAGDAPPIEAVEAWPRAPAGIARPRQRPHERRRIEGAVVYLHP